MSEESKNDETKKEIKKGSEQIKSEAKSTFNDAKETIKNVNFKNDAKVTSGYVSNLLKKPLETINEVANDSKNTKFKNALILVVLWLIVVLLKSIFGVHWISLGSNFLLVIKNLLAPLVGLFGFSCVLFFMQKGSKKKTLTTIVTTITTASTPLILASVLDVLTLFSYDISRITNPIIYFATVLSVVLVYFASKSILNEESNSNFIKKFITVEAIYYVIYFVFTFLQIYIPMI